MVHDPGDPRYDAIFLVLSAAEAAQRLDDVVDALGGRDDVEGNGERGFVLDVLHVELAAGKLPLRVRLALNRTNDARYTNRDNSAISVLSEKTKKSPRL